MGRAFSVAHLSFHICHQIIQILDYISHRELTTFYNNFYYASITLFLAMNSNPGAVGALILVPIAIAGSAAFIAINAPHLWYKVATWCKILFLWTRRDRRKHRQSDLSESQPYADSLYDLESLLSRARNTIVQSASLKDTPTKIWHPLRSSRLTWSFGGSPQSQSLSHSESLKSVQRPSPAVMPLQRSQSQEEDSPDQLMPMAHLLKAHTAP